MADESMHNAVSPTPTDLVSTVQPTNRGLSLDWAAVITALVMVLLIWLGVFQSIPW